SGGVTIPPHQIVARRDRHPAGGEGGDGDDLVGVQAQNPRRRPGPRRPVERPRSQDGVEHAVRQPLHGGGRVRQRPVDTGIAAGGLPHVKLRFDLLTRGVPRCAHLVTSSLSSGRRPGYGRPWMLMLTPVNSAPSPSTFQRTRPRFVNTYPLLITP